MTEPNDTSWAVPEGGAPIPSSAPGAPGAPAPQPAPAPLMVPRRKSGALINAVLVVGALVAVGGIAFALGRSTAPAQASVFPGGQGVVQGSGQGFPGGLPDGSFDPGQGGPGGFPGGGDRTMTISGTVKSIDGSTMVITTASGSETAIDVSGAAYHAQADASASDVAVGTEVSVATEGFGGFRRQNASAAPDASAAPAAGSGTITATDVTITSRD